MRNCNPQKSKPCGKSCIKRAFLCRKGDKPSKPKKPKCTAPRATKPKRTAPKRTAPQRTAPKRTAPKRTTCSTQKNKLINLPMDEPIKNVRRAYINASKVCHPDRGGTTDDQQCVNWHFDHRKSYFGLLGRDQVGRPPKNCGATNSGF